ACASIGILFSCGEKLVNDNLQNFPDQAAIVLNFEPEPGEYSISQHVSTETKAATMHMTSSMTSHQQVHLSRENPEFWLGVLRMEKIRMEMSSPMKGLMEGGVYNSDYPDSAQGTMALMQA